MLFAFILSPQGQKHVLENFGLVVIQTSVYFFVVLAVLKGVYKLIKYS
jgi:hypothetical protein